MSNSFENYNSLALSRLFSFQKSRLSCYNLKYLTRITVPFLFVHMDWKFLYCYVDTFYVSFDA